MKLIRYLLSPITALIVFIQNHFKATVFLFIVFLMFAPSSEENLSSNNLTQIDLAGPIMDATEVVEKINEAAEDDAIKGILLNVDSPGGAVAPSIEIAYAIKRAKLKKPVVAYANGTMASGSYYSSIWANEIIANPGSMIGSIGVIMQGADISGLMSKIGVKTQIIQAGKYKQVGTVDREWTADETAELNKVIQGTYELFATDVATARKLDINKKEVYADAHIFTASQAKNVGLVDKLGVSADAKKRVEELSKVSKPVWNKEDEFDKLMKKITAQTAVAIYTYFPEMVLK